MSVCVLTVHGQCHKASATSFLLEYMYIYIYHLQTCMFRCFAPDQCSFVHIQVCDKFVFIHMRVLSPDACGTTRPCQRTQTCAECHGAIYIYIYIQDNTYIYTHCLEPKKGRLFPGVAGLMSTVCSLSCVMRLTMFIHIRLY